MSTNWDSAGYDSTWVMSPPVHIASMYFCMQEVQQRLSRGAARSRCRVSAEEVQQRCRGADTGEVQIMMCTGRWRC